MPLPPVEFELQGHRFRHHPLPAMPWSQELHKLLVRFDNDSGVLNTLAFNFTAEEYSEIADFTPPGIARLIKLVSMVIGTDRRGDEPEELEDEDGETIPPLPKPVDALPDTLDGLFLYYAGVGKTQFGVNANGSDMWVDLQSAEQFNEHPLQIAPMVCAFHVLKGIFVPLGGPLREFADAAKAKKAERDQTSMEPISQSETDPPQAPPTSET